MNRIAAKRRKIRRQSHLGLAALLLSTASSGAMAETRTNPYFKAASTSPPSATTRSSTEEAVGNATSARLTRLGPIEVAPAVEKADETIPDRPDFGQPVADAQFIQQWLGERKDEPQAESVTPVLPPAKVPAPRRLAKATPEAESGFAAHSEPTASSAHKPPSVARPDWRQSITRESCEYRARRHLENAYREYSVGAWASAEASAWKSLELTATGIDVDDGNAPAGGERNSTSESLRVARTAIEEAMDFVSFGAAVDPDTMTGIAASHQTPVLNSEIPQGFSPTAAVDRYLDFATVRLAPIATRQVEAAQAMDLIAAIKLGRDAPRQLPEEMALCLRRAALRGQPSNAGLAARLGMQLADMGLHSEARQTLQHAMSLEPTREVAQTLANVMIRCNDADAATQLLSQFRPDSNGTPEAPETTEVVQLSPTEFALISPAFNHATPSVLPSVVDATGSTTSASPMVASVVDGPNIQTVLPGADLSSPPRSFFSGMLAGFRKPFSRKSSSDGPSSDYDPADVSIPSVDSLTIENNVDSMLRSGREAKFQTVGAKKAQKSMVGRVIGAIPKPW